MRRWWTRRTSERSLPVGLIDRAQLELCSGSERATMHGAQAPAPSRLDIT